MDYRQAWAFLDNLQFFKIKLGLESMARFLDDLGQPQRRGARSLIPPAEGSR